MIYPLVARAIFAEKPVFHSSETTSVALLPNLGIVIKPSSEGVHKAPESLHEATVYEQMVASAFPDAPIMVRIARAESQFNPLADNPKSTATGLFQVLNGTRDHYGCGDQTIPEEAIKCARKIYDKEGTRPWKSSEHMW